MKITKISIYSNKLLKLELLKAGIYSTNNYLNYVGLEDIEHRLKKGFCVIYKLCIINKFMLFVRPIVHIKKWINLINILTVKSLWVRGILTNPVLYFKDISKNHKVLLSNKVLKLLFSLRKRIDLLVIFDEFLDKGLVDEGYLVKIPIVSLNSNLAILDNKSCYRVSGYSQLLKSQTVNGFFCFLLVTLLKKVTQIKQLRL